MSGGERRGARARSGAKAGPKGEIIVIGLGPGRWEDLTIEARDLLLSAQASSAGHCVIPPLTRYESAGRVSRSNRSTPSMILLIASPRSTPQWWRNYSAAPPSELVIYAVPGHPLLGEESVRLLRPKLRAWHEGAYCRRSLYLEPVCAALRLDPLERDLQSSTRHAWRISRSPR